MVTVLMSDFKNKVTLLIDFVWFLIWPQLIFLKFLERFYLQFINKIVLDSNQSKPKSKPYFIYIKLDCLFILNLSDGYDNTNNPLLKYEAKVNSYQV